MSKRSAFLVAVPFAAFFMAACSTETTEEDEGTTGSDALSQAECAKVVESAVSKSVAECKRKESDLDAKTEARERLEDAVVSALPDFAKELSAYNGKAKAEVAETVRECSAVGCSGELQRDGVKAECGVEQAFLRGACYVRKLPELRAAATDLDFGDETTRLVSAVADMTENWGALSVQETWLYNQHNACSIYAGSAAQKVKLNATCRASCNENDATSVGKIGVGQGSACTPPGYEDVKDDLGATVECGAFKRPLMNLGTVCECRTDDACTQFATLAGSSERGKTCAKGKTKKIVWHAQDRTARLECR